MIISISGSSGVGKTTLSELFAMAAGKDESLILSGDDLHRWERTHPSWKTYTHLNPAANDLELGHNHLLDLKNGLPVNRNLYNHDTGKFEEQIKINPKKTIIYEGLHSLYLEKTAKLADIKIFVDTDNSLKTEWKLKRDTKKRGYTKEEVMNAISRRTVDEILHIKPQKDRADIIVKFTKNKNSSITLEYECKTGIGKQAIEKVKDLYDCLNKFIDTCKWLSLDPSLIQERGGNISLKMENKMLITSSGFKMSDVNINSGHCIVDLNKIKKKYYSEQDYIEILESSKVFGQERSSMETGLHFKMKQKAVVHTHPIHVNTILCSKEARQVIDNLFEDMKYDFIDYVTPGFNLANFFNSDNNIIFLKNHGLLVGDNSLDAALEITESINNRCKKWIDTNTESFIETKKLEFVLPLFPDAAIFPEKMESINSYIFNLINKTCLTPDFLKNEHIEDLKKSESEKYRLSLTMIKGEQ